MFASFAKDSAYQHSTMDDLDKVLTEQDENYGKLICDRNFNFMSQYNASFLN